MNNTNNKTPNNNFKVRACYYNYSKDKEDVIDYIGTSSSPTNVNITADAGVADYLPCVAVEYSGNIYDSNENTTGGINLCDDFSCSFKVNTTFVTNNGYDGCIGFAWTNKSLGEDIIPSDCHACNYNEAVTQTNCIGLFDASLNRTEIKGFSLTLYPSVDPVDYIDIYYRTKLSRYMITYKNTENELVHIAGYFPNNSKVDLFDTDWNLLDIVLSVKYVDGIYEFYINDMFFASIPNNNNEIDMEWGENEGYFTANMIAAHYIEANLDITDINNNFHLTQTEKRNLSNLGTSVLNYYEVGDTDDTGAFQRALADEDVRRVYVPGGTYKIKGELVVRDNCELELAQDAVLEFDFTDPDEPIPASTTPTDGSSGTDTDDGIDRWTDEAIRDAKKCITLKMLSSLVGNHATIRVPYDFDGIVIYASTRSHPTSNSINLVPPFNRWDPQWKPARYLKDINIVKPIEIGHEITYRKPQEEIDELKKKADYNSEIDDYITANVDGIHASVNNTCNGTAVFIEGYRSGNGGSTFIWGLDYSGIRIAGAFEYGVKCTNNHIWVNNKGTYIPNPPEDKTGLKKKWAWTHDISVNAIIDGCKTGVHLEHCNNVRISAIIQPRPAYIEKTQTDFTPYALYGFYFDSCKNVDLSGSRVWDWNKTNTKWTAGGENQHLRLVGKCEGLILDDFKYYAEDSYALRDLIKSDNDDNFNNFDNMTILQEPVSRFISVDTDNTKRTLLADRKIDNETVPGEIVTAYGMTATDMIYCGRNDENAIEITVNNFNFNEDSDSLIAFYDENYSHISNAAISTTAISAPTEAKYFRISCNTDIIGDEPSINVNDNIVSFKTNYLKDNVYIKQQYVEGLQEILDALEGRIYALGHPDN